MLTLDHKSLIIQSYNNSSFSPERRGEQDFEFYQSQLEQDLVLIQSINGSTGSYATKYIDKLMRVYNHKSYIASAMIVGPAKFKANTKRLNWERNAYEDFTRWRERYLRLVQRVARPSIDDAIVKAQADAPSASTAQNKRYHLNKVRELESRKDLADSFEPISILGGSIYYENERLIVKHEDKPSHEVIVKIKKRGFKFSPKTKSWVRQFTHNAVMSAKILAEELNA